MSSFESDKYTKLPCIGKYTEPARELPIVERVDVLVVGGSQSGSVAAIAAARNGAKVRLVEQYGFLGGQSVFGSVTQYEKRAFINNLGAVQTRGIPKELVERIVAKGNSDNLWRDPPGCPEMRDGEEWLDVEDIKTTLIEMCEEAGVNILLHTLAVDVVVDRSKSIPRMTGVIFENKNGRFVIQAKIIIDATADLDLVWRAIGEDGCGIQEPKKRMGSGFYVWYGGIDNEKFIEYMLKSKDNHGYPDTKKNPDKVRDHLKTDRLIYFLGGLGEILDQAEEKGLMEPVEKIMDEAQITGILNLNMKWVGHDRWNLHLVEIPGINHLDTWNLTKFEIFRTKLENYMLPVVRLIPGWEKTFIARTNIRMGARESRYLHAITMLSAKDVFYPDHNRCDVVGRSGAHDPGKNRLKEAYPIPYGMMVPAKLDGVICCSRAVGAEPGIALNAHRGIMPGMVLAQAAGTAGAIASSDNVEPRDLDIKELQDALRKADVVLDREHMDLKNIDWSKVRPIPKLEDD